MTVDLDAVPLDFTLPVDFAPPTPLHVRAVDLPSLELESRLAAKLDAVRAFARVNSLDKHIVSSPRGDAGHRHRRQGALRLHGGAAPPRRSTPTRWPPPACASTRSGLVFPLEPTRMLDFAARARGDPGHRGEGAGRRAPDQGAAVRRCPTASGRASPARPTATAGRCCRRWASCGRRASWPVVADWLARLNPALDRRQRVVDFTMPALLSNDARRGEAPALLLLGLPAQHAAPRCRKDRARWPASAATSWPAGWSAAPAGLIQMGAEGVDWAAHSRFTRERRTSSRTSATAPTSTPACWRSARPSRPAPTSPTRSSTTTRSR